MTFRYVRVAGFIHAYIQRMEVKYKVSQIPLRLRVMRPRRGASAASFRVLRPFHFLLLLLKQMGMALSAGQIKPGVKNEGHN